MADSGNLTIHDNDFPVSEIFTSIQGEGNYAGVNSLFIRLQLCNLRCPWCDTKYTWIRFSDRFDIQTTEQLSQIIADHPQQHVILTGGEPSLFRLDRLAVAGKKFHVESNGTIIPTVSLDLDLGDGTLIQRDAMDADVIARFNWVISPKLSNAKQPLNEEALAFWAQQPYAIFKFIAQDTTDLDEITALIQQHGIDSHRVYIGLLGSTLESQLRPDFVDEIVQRGYHYSPRLHVLLWRQQREK